MDYWGREAFEGMLALAAYIAYCESCVDKQKTKTSIFKNLPHRSAGPLWHLLQQALQTLGDKSQFSGAYLPLLRDPYKTEINETVTQLAQQKHGKIPTNLDYPRILTMLGNFTNTALANRVFGFFEQITQKRFQTTFSGIFRSAKGASPPFVEIFEYEGAQTFSPDQVFICDRDTGQALPLSPLIIMGLGTTTSHYEHEEMYFYDTERPKDTLYAYKSIRPGKEQQITGDGDLAPLFERLRSMKELDPESSLISGVKLQSRTEA
jgi:hypothetical protein